MTSDEALDFAIRHLRGDRETTRQNLRSVAKSEPETVDAILAEFDAALATLSALRVHLAEVK